MPCFIYLFIFRFFVIFENWKRGIEYFVLFFVLYFMLHQSQFSMYLFDFSYEIIKVKKKIKKKKKNKKKKKKQQQQQQQHGKLSYDRWRIKWKRLSASKNFWTQTWKFILVSTLQWDACCHGSRLSFWWTNRLFREIIDHCHLYLN